MKVSLVITNYNRTDLLLESFENVINDDRIDEILIVDDCSDLEVFKYIETKTKRIPKVKLIKNEVNKGMALNKAYAVSQSKNKWLILFDSDNIIDGSYLDTFFKIKDLKNNCIYMPDFAKPKYDFGKHSGKYFGISYTSDNILTDNLFNVCLNTCNYIANRDYYTKVFQINEKVKGVDTLYHAYNHLKLGGIFYIVPNMQYYHRTHDGSEFLKNTDYNIKFGRLLSREIQGLNRIPHVTCKLKGRFGNHLFTIATTIAYALEHNLLYHIPEDLYFKDLVSFSYNQRLPRQLIFERQHNYIKLPPPRKNTNIVLDGHYQTEKYFENYRNEILKIFNFKPNKSEYVAIHVRRGDYLQNPKSFPFVGIEYIKKGIEYFKSKGYTKFMVFGEDYQWNTENIKDNECEFVFKQGDMMQDFLDMAGCKAHIISNSTFSWWAAWIVNGEVVAPKTWFGDGAKHLNTKDIIPERWIKF